jgi:PAS domain S-box-containing protein
LFSSQKTVVDLGMPARPGHDTAMSIPAKSGLTRAKEYGLAVGVTLLALLARFLLDPYLGDRLPYETFFVAVGVTAWYGGLGASLTAVLLGAVLSNWFFSAPREAFGLGGVTEQISYLAYFMVTLAFVSVEQSLGRARRLTGAAMQDLQRGLIERRRAEEALRESEERLRLANLATNDAIWDWHIDTDAAMWNQGVEKLFGWNQASCSPCTLDWWLERIHVDDRDRVAEHFSGMFGDPTRAHWEEKYRFRKADGTYAYVFDRGYALRHPSGKPFRMLRAMADITKIKEAEAGLRARGNQLSLLYDLASTVNRADDLDLIYDKALDAILTSMQADRAAILLFDDQGVMQFQAWKGLSENYRRAVAGHSPWKRDDTAATPIVVEDVAEADIDSALKARILEEGIRALAFVPLISSGQIIGKFMVYFDRPWKVGQEDLGVAQGIAGTLTTGIQRKRDEQALRESAERLRLAVESAEIGTWDLNWITGDNRWDRRCKALFGLAPEADVPYEAFLAMLHPEDRARVLATIQRSVHPSSDGSYDVEYRIVLADGRERWIRAMGRAFFEEREGERRPVRFMGTALDVTQRKRSETELRESEQRLQMALQVGEAGTWDLNFRTGRNLWSDSHFRLVGREPTPTREATPDIWQTAILAEDRDRVMAEWRRAEAARDLFRSQHRIRRHDNGHVIWVRAFGQFHYEQDRAVRFVGAVQNINDLKQAEQALRESEERLRLATEAAEVGIWEWNVATNHIRWDGQMFRIYGMAPTENGLVPYETWSNAVLPEDLPEQERLLQETVAQRGHGVRVFRITRAKDGMMMSFRQPCRNDNAGARRYLNTKTSLRQYGRGESPSGG